MLNQITDNPVVIVSVAAVALVGILLRLHRKREDKIDKLLKHSFDGHTALTSYETSRLEFDAAMSQASKSNYSVDFTPTTLEIDTTSRLLGTGIHSSTPDDAV